MKRVEVPGMGVVEFPDGMSDAQIASAIKANMTPQEFQKSESDQRKELLKGELYSFLSPLRGAKDVIDTGAQLLSRLAGPEEAERVKAMNEAGKAEFAANTKGSMVAPVGRFAGQLAVTAPMAAGVGGAVSTVAPRVGQALASGGFTNAPIPIRLAGGAGTGMLTAGAINPDRDSVAMGGLLGGALPLAGSIVSPLATWMSRWLMQSAVKPTIPQLKSGDAKVAVDTMLEKGISPTKGGVEKLRSLIGDKNQQIADLIKNSPATVNKFAVARPLSETAAKFTRQVNPTDDLNAISKVGLDFLNHPIYQGVKIPVQAAQEMKQGTYSILAKKYGQVGTAETEAQKALARGLKDEIGSAVPAVKALNAEEARLIRTLDVAERRALAELNKNPMGLSLLASSPGTWAAFMADRSAAFKALAARMLYSSNQGAGLLAPAAGVSSGLLSAEPQ